jgi:hypothetical protein
MFAASQQARYIFMQNIEANTATAKWLNNGDGAGRIVVLRADNNWGATETALGATTTAFSDNAGALSGAPQIGATGSYVVDVHTGNTKQIGLTGLASGTVYWIRIFDWDQVAGVYTYLTSIGGYNNPRNFTTLNAIPQPPTDIVIDPSNCFFDISWTLGENSTGTIMSLYYDEDDNDLCGDGEGALNDFTGEGVLTEWEMIDLGDLTSIEGFPLFFFNHDHRVEMWGYNGNVANISATFTDEEFAPDEDCEGPTYDITVRHLIWNEETEEWEIGDEVFDETCDDGERYRVFVNWSEPVDEFTEDNIILAGATMVEDTWFAGETNEEFSFDIEVAVLVGDVGITINGTFEDCVGNSGGGSGDYNIPPLNLLSTENFAVLAGYLISGTSTTAINNGDVGLSPETGASITGFDGTDVTNGFIYTVDAAGPAGSVPNAELLTAAKNDLTIAYNDAAGRTPVPEIGPFLNPTGGTSILTGTPVVPGLYKFEGAASIPSSITFDGGGNPNSVWIFQIASGLTVSNDVIMSLDNGASAANIFWQVGSTATIGTNATFQGTILANNAITVATGSTVNGRILARLAEVTMQEGVTVNHPGSLPYDFQFSIDNVAPIFTEGPEFTGEETFECVTTNNWSYEGFPETLPVNNPENVNIEIGFDVEDIGCCGSSNATINVLVLNTETSEWDVYASDLVYSTTDFYDYQATFTVTTGTPDGMYQFEVILDDCNENGTTWTGLGFTVDQTAPDGYQVECVTELNEEEEEEVTTCLPVEEWVAPCLGEGDVLTLCTAIIEDGCGEFNIESAAFPGDNGLGLIIIPEPNNYEISSVTGSGTTEDPYIVCVTITVTAEDEEGSYATLVWGTDPAGNFNIQVDEGKFTIDLTPPNFYTEEILEDCYGDEDEIDLCFSVDDGEIGCGVESVTVEIIYDDEEIDPIVLEVNQDEEDETFYCFAYTVDAETTPEGAATIVITVTDYAGNETIETYETNFDFTAPALVGEVLLPEDDCLSDGQQFCVTFTLEDLGCGIDFSSQEHNWFNYTTNAIYDEEADNWAITVCYNISTEENGTYDFWYSVNDYAGNEFILDLEDAFTIDNTDPVITDLMVSDDCVTNTDVVTITFNASDAYTCCVDSFFDVFVTLTFSNSTTVNASFVSAVSASGGGWDYTFTHTVLPGNPSGTVLVDAYAVDCAGNEGTMDATFQIDRTAPIVSNLAVDPNDCVAPGVELNMTFTASDIGGCGVLDCDAAWAVLTFSNSTTVMVEFGEEENCFSYESDGTVSFSAYYTVGEDDPAGPVTVTVFVKDGAGNTGSQQLINAVTIDNTAPVVENITVDETCVTLEDVVTICFDASDLGCGDFDDANLEVTVWYAETFWPGVYSDNEGNNYCFTFAVSGSETHPSGSYSVTVMATDDAGNETTETLEDAFQVVHAPVMAEWSVNGLDEECGVTNANPICFDFEFDREVFDFTASDIWVSFGFEVASVEGEGDSWTVCVNALSVSGTGTLYMYVSEVYDCAGNQYTAYDISANYDYVAPSGYTAMFTNSEGEEIDYINAMTCDEIYVTITGGVVGEVANWTIMVGEVEYSGWTLITSDPQTVNLSDPLITYDFTGPFATSNWDVLEEGNSMAAFSGNTILLLTGSNGSETPQANVDVTIVIPVDGTVSFDWDYETSDGPEWDPFGYLLNGNFFELTDEDGSDFQSGFESIPVSAGDIFGFRQNTVDDIFGEAVTEINNFMFEQDGIILCDDEEGEVYLAVTLTDCAGNEGEDATDEVILDITPPCVVIDAPSHANDDFDVTFTWSEDVMGFDVGDLVVTNGSTYGFAGSGADYTVGIAPTSEGLVMISITSYVNGITDLAGNPFNGEDSECNDEAETIYDITPPEFDALSWDNDNVELLLYWDEAVMGSGGDVELTDLALTFLQNGGTATGVTLTGVTHTEGDDYAYLTIEVDGTPNGCEEIEIRPATNSSVFDLAGNNQDVNNMISINLVNASFPEVQASGGFADNVYAVQARLNWTRGDGEAVIVILFEDNDCVVDPVNGVNYDADSDFGWGSFLSCSDYSGGHVVYYGTGTQVTVDYLTGCTNYRAVVYEVIGGDCENPNYMTPGHEFEFETGPVATELRITHINGVPYDQENCDFALPSASVFSVTVGLFGYACDDSEMEGELVPAYLPWDDYIYLNHAANWNVPLVDYEVWPISQTSKTFTNLQFGINNGCSNIGDPARDSYFDACCDALFAFLDYSWLWDDGPLSFRGGEAGQQAYGITFSNTTNNKFDISWLKSGATTATGEGSLLVIKQGSVVNVFPQDGIVYGAEMGVSTLNFTTAGEDIGSGNRALLYQLDCACDESFQPRAVQVTGLTPNTTYYARVFEIRYDVDYVNYGGCYIGNEQYYGEGCENIAERFKDQENVVKYRTSTGTGNPRSKKTSAMEGMFAGLELINFDGRSFERKVELAWATASEGGSLGFEIYRADAETFEFVKIANVAGNVNGSTYKLLDDDLSLEVGKTYVYRLSYISKDGTIEDLSEILVPILTMPNSMQSIFVSQVTPNPVTDFGKLTVEMTNEQNLKIEIRNAAGQLVSVLSDQVRGAGVHNFNFDLTNRAQGSYSILISTDYEAIYVPFMYVK